MSLILALAMYAKFRFQEYITDLYGTLDVETLFLAYLGFTQFVLLMAHVIRKVRISGFSSRLHLRPPQVFIISFLFAISIGTLLLKLPKATTEPISWLDALFTATSAVCVTGLIVVDTATRFTPLGQGIICLLFQLGGLGIMTLTMSLGILFSGGLGVRERVVLGNILSEDRMGEVGKLLATITLFTFGVESVGIFGLYFFSGGSIWSFDLTLFLHSTFHAISAFCNAGFSLYSEGLYAAQFRNNYSYLSVIIILIFIGGMGFPVAKNIYDAIRTRGRKSSQRRVLISTTSKLILYTTFFLVLAGTSTIFFLERSHSFSDISFFDQLFQSFFLSIASRTAGFNIWPTHELALTTCIVVGFLMWVGGAPMSTAGGIKTLTFAVAVMAVKAVVTGRNQIEVFGREITQNTIIKSFSIILLSIVIIFGASTALIAFEPHLNPQDLIFEVVSAFGTVGLSRGLTAELSDASKLLITILMLGGRIGFITVLSSFFTSKKDDHYKYLKEHVPIS